MQKPPVGTIRIGVATYGGRLLLTVSDDGQGIDDEALYQAAKAQGLIQEEQEKMPRESLHRLLFAPGFSTRGSTAALSGRGVGLDVVEATATRLGGEVSVRSDRGRGATFLVDVPLSYARLSILPLRAGGEWIGVNAAEVTRLEPVATSEGLLSAAALFPASVDPALVGSREARSPFVRVECLGGSKWAFEEAGPAQDALVREAVALAKNSRGVVGSARLENGRSVLLVDLNLLAALVGQAHTPLV